MNCTISKGLRDDILCALSIMHSKSQKPEQESIKRIIESVCGIKIKEDKNEQGQKTTTK